MQNQIRKDKYPESYTIFRKLDENRIKLGTNKSTQLHSLTKTYTCLNENYLLTIMSFDHSRIFFPQLFLSASHADSSFVGASDIGQ